MSTGEHAAVPGSSLGSSLGSGTSRLVMLRGNSGSGKSTVAQRLRDARPPHTVALVGQDNLRREVLGVRDGRATPAVGLIDLTVRHALRHGLDVVLEGILHAPTYGDMLRHLAADHAGTTRCFFFDLSWEETVRRHATKVAPRFGEAEMRTWWYGYQPVEGLHEELVPEAASLEQTVSRLLGCWAPDEE